MTTSSMAIIIQVVGYVGWVWGVLSIAYYLDVRKPRKKRQEKAFFDLLYTRRSALSKDYQWFKHLLALNNVEREFSVGEHIEIYRPLAFYAEHLDTNNPVYLTGDGLRTMTAAGVARHKELLTDLLEAMAKHVKFNISREDIADGIEPLMGNVVRRPVIGNRVAPTIRNDTLLAAKELELWLHFLYKILCDREWYKIDDGGNILSSRIVAGRAAEFEVANENLQILRQILRFTSKFTKSIEDAATVYGGTLKYLYNHRFVESWENYRAHLRVKGNQYINVDGSMNPLWLEKEEELLSTLVDSLDKCLKYEPAMEGESNDRH